MKITILQPYVLTSITVDPWNCHTLYAQFKWVIKTINCIGTTQDIYLCTINFLYVGGWGQVEQLQNTKLQLETVNDSMTAQLEEHKKKEEDLEEELEEIQRKKQQDDDTFQSQVADMEVKIMCAF